LYFKAILRQEIGWFDRINPNELATQVVQQCIDIQNAIGEKVATFVQAVFQTLAGLVIGYVYGWKLALVCTAVVPAIALAMFVYVFML
jgi:ATP-binding cassette subfamily B (MDR/TAP) protein 1